MPPDEKRPIKCSHCNVDRCAPLPFCYSIQYSKQSRSTGDYCADEAEMFSLVGSQLDATTASNGKKRRSIHESCLSSINIQNLSYCVCQTFDDYESSQEYDALKRIRIWRYQSLLFHDNLNTLKMSSTSLGMPAAMVFVLFKSSKVAFF